MELLNSLAFAWRHPLARLDPLGTVRRIAGWQVKSRLLAGPFDQPWVNGSRLIVARGDTGATANLYFGLHEVADMAFFAHLLRPGEGFIDAGANVGSYTVLTAIVAGARVHAFEPAAETLPKLRRNIAANAIDALVYPVALGAEDGEIAFTSGLGAMNRAGEGAATVAVRRLDGLAIDAVAMKADLEGGELAMLRGAGETLRRLLAVEVETLESEAEAILGEVGFSRRWYDPFARSLRAEPVGTPHNALFVRDEAAVAARLKAGPVIRFGRIAL